MKRKMTSNRGFTLIEFLVYIGIASMVLVTAIITGMNLITGSASSIARQETYYNARLVMNQIQYQVRAADDVITANSTFASHPGVLVLDYPGTGSDVIIDTYTKSVSIGGEATNIRKLRIKEGEDAYVDLTGDKVNVSNFVVSNLSRGVEPINLRIQLTIESANPGNDPKYDASITLQTALSTRR